jgi:isopentenyl-diphosphate Delta-isomerase
MKTSKEKVVLVDRQNRKIGTEEKLKAHLDGKLHRAFSIFVFNREGELLLQRRAKTKYHSPGIWSNTVCSHPMPGESYKKAVHRRLMEEMGFECGLKRAFSFVYRAKLDKGITEYEHDTVFIGHLEPNEVKLKPNPDEVCDYKWVSLDELKKDLQASPEIYSAWIGIALKNSWFRRPGIGRKKPGKSQSL